MIKWPALCVPVSIFCGWTAEIHGHRSRILTQRIGPGMNHVQAECLESGLWVPLTPLWDAKDGLTVQSYTRHFEHEVIGFHALDEFIEQQRGHRGR